MSAFMSSTLTPCESISVSILFSFIYEQYASLHSLFLVTIARRLLRCGGTSYPPWNLLHSIRNECRRPRLHASPLPDRAAAPARSRRRAHPARRSTHRGV